MTANNARVDVGNVAWRDLVPMTCGEKIRELALQLPWLALSLWGYQCGGAWIFAGALGSFYVFLTGLRQSHGAQHYSLGVSRKWQDGVLFGLSLIMLASMHAVQASHLHHHRHCLDDEDTEGAAAKMKWWQAILTGPVFLITMHRTAWRLAERSKRRWIAAELAGILLLLALCAVTPWAALHWHVAAMIGGECLTGFFAVWTVHHDCGADPLPARTQRGCWFNWLCYDMFYHAEHHLFPVVPTCHLAMLAKRIDQVSSGEWRQVLEPFHAAQSERRRFQSRGSFR